MAWRDIDSKGSMPERPGRRKLAALTGPLAEHKLARPIPPESRPVMAQIGWVGQSGAVYALDDEPCDGREPSLYRPLYVQVGEWVQGSDGSWAVDE